jgi:hypothetical protein
VRILFFAGLHFVDKDLFLDVGANHYHKGLFGFFRLSVEHPYDEGYYPQAQGAQFPIVPLRDPVGVNVQVDSQSLSQTHQALNQVQNDKFMAPAIQQDPIDEEVSETTVTELIETTTVEITTPVPKRIPTTTKRIFRPRSAGKVKFSKLKPKSKYNKRQADSSTTVVAETTFPETTVPESTSAPETTILMDGGVETTSTASTIPTTTGTITLITTTKSLSSYPPNNGYGASRTRNVDQISFTTDSPFVGQNRIDYVVNNFKPSMPDYIRNIYSSDDYYPRAVLNFID